jgi:hypothetical protein
MLEFSRAVSSARHTVSVADRVQCLDNYDSTKAEELINKAEAELEEYLATTDISY